MSVLIRTQKNSVSIPFSANMTVSELVDKGLQKLNISKSAQKTYYLTMKQKELPNASVVTQCSINQGSVLELHARKNTTKQTKRLKSLAKSSRPFHTCRLETCDQNCL